MAFWDDVVKNVKDFFGGIKSTPKQAPRQAPASRPSQSWNAPAPQAAPQRQQQWAPQQQQQWAPQQQQQWAPLPRGGGFGGGGGRMMSASAPRQLTLPEPKRFEPSRATATVVEGEEGEEEQTPQGPVTTPDFSKYLAKTPAKKDTPERKLSTSPEQSWKNLGAFFAEAMPSGSGSTTPKTEVEQAERAVQLARASNAMGPRAGQSQELARGRVNAATQALSGAEEGASRVLSGTFETREMTHEEYNALNSRQRAAVDANTALAKAIELDRDLFDTDGGDKNYNARVKDMFGEDGGSDRYAPNTVALLSELGVGDKESGDLDNYLDLSALVSSDDLLTLGDDYTPELPGMLDGDRYQRMANTSLLTDAAVSTLSQTLGRGQDLLDSMRTSEFNPDGKLFQDTPSRGSIYGQDPELDNQLDMMFAFAQGELPDQTEGDPREGMGRLAHHVKTTFNVSDEQLTQFFDDRYTALEYDSYVQDAENPISAKDLQNDFRARFGAQ